MCHLPSMQQPAGRQPRGCNRDATGARAGCKHVRLKLVVTVCVSCSLYTLTVYKYKRQTLKL